MTPIEDLLREALAATPEPAPSTDPLGTLDRRLRRARRRLAAGAGVVAAVVAAAIVVPLTVGGGGGAPRSVQVVTPQPSATPTPPPSGTTALWTGDAVWATTSPSGTRWLLYTDADTQSWVTAVTGRRETPVRVDSAADYVVASDRVVWVIRSGDGGQNTSELTAFDTTGKKAYASMALPTTALSFSAAVGDSLYVDASDASGSAVRRYDFRAGDIKLVATHPVAQAAEIVATRGGQLWVHSGKHLVELAPTADGFDVKSPVSWGDGAMFAPTLPRSGPDGVWAYDGSRLIGLMPSALSGCVSCAEGDRVAVAGRPNAVVETPDGLYVAIPGVGLDYYSPNALGSGETPVTASIKGVQVITMTADPVAGVDYVDDQGNLIRWDPTCQDAQATTCR